MMGEGMMGERDSHDRLPLELTIRIEVWCLELAQKTQITIIQTANIINLVQHHGKSFYP